MKKRLLWIMLIAILLAGCRLVPDDANGPFIRLVVSSSETPLSEVSQTPQEAEKTLPTATPAPLLAATLAPSASVEPAITLLDSPEPAVIPTLLATLIPTRAADQSLESKTTTSAVAATPTIVPTLYYQVQSGAPLLTRAFLHTADGCNWLGVAGQFFNASGDPVQNVLVAIVGNVAGQSVEGLGYTGLVDGYGPGGYEIKLSSTVGAGIFWIQAYDQQGNPLTDIFSFQMMANCDNNLALINFRQTMGEYELNLPVVVNH
jgi:hypothetical protein